MKFDTLQDHEFRRDEWAAREREPVVKVEPCPCGKAPECLPGRHYRQVACRRCGRRGPLAPDEDLAVKLWNNDRRFIWPLGYEHAITIGWNEHNARRHWLIEAKRSRVLSESESAELAELQWLAGIKRELQTGPRPNVNP